MVLADDFIEVDDIRWTTEPCPQPVWDSEAEKEEVRTILAGFFGRRMQMIVRSLDRRSRAPIASQLVPEVAKSETRTSSHGNMSSTAFHAHIGRGRLCGNLAI